MQTRNEERHMVFVNDVCEKMEVGLGTHITSTKQVCENKQPSIEVHSMAWPSSEHDVRITGYSRRWK